MLDPSYVEEYAERPREEISPWKEGECMKTAGEYFEDEFDHNPTHRMNRHLRSKYTHGHGPHQCMVCCNAPITALSDYGFIDFNIYDEDDEEPEWVGMCWGCYRGMYYTENGIPDPAEDNG